MSGEDERRLRDLLMRYGGQDSLGYFALRRDTRVVWSPTGEAAISYRVRSGVSLACGDPIGDPRDWSAVIDAWLAESHRHAGTPVVFGCGDLAGRAYRRHGLDAVEVGQEAIVEVAEVSLAGRQMRGVRQVAGRIERAGYRCDVAYQHDLPVSILEQAVAAARRWRDGQSARGASMDLARIGDRADDGCVFALAWDETGHLRGLLQFVPWGADGLCLDLMRRDRAADAGLIEFMVLTVAHRARGLGIRRLSLNLTAQRPFLDLGPTPRWRPRYLCLPPTSSVDQGVLEVVSPDMSDHFSLIDARSG